MHAPISPIQPAAFARTGVGLVVAIVGGGLVVALSFVGLVLFGLAIAFPIASPIAEQLGLAVPPADVELARGLAEFWWLFLGAAIAVVAAAGAIAVGLIRRLSPTARD